MKNIYLSFLLITALFVVSSCGDDDGIVIDTATYEGSANINPNNFPAGIGLDMNEGDSGRVAQLDAEANLPWDIQVITYRTSMGGRPGILLFGDQNSQLPVRALNVSQSDGIGTGLAGFNSFTQVSATMTAGLQPDGEFTFDPETDVDSQGRADIVALQTAYNNLIIGNKTVNLDPDDQPVFLIATRESILYKFQLAERANGGQTTLRWARFSNDAIN